MVRVQILGLARGAWPTPRQALETMMPTKRRVRRPRGGRRCVRRAGSRRTRVPRGRRVPRGTCSTPRASICIFLRDAPAYRMEDDGSAREPRGPRLGCVPAVGSSLVGRYRRCPAARRASIGSRRAPLVQVRAAASSSWARYRSGAIRKTPSVRRAAETVSSRVRTSPDRRQVRRPAAKASAGQSQVHRMGSCSWRRVGAQGT